MPDLEELRAFENTHAPNHEHLEIISALQFKLNLAIKEISRYERLWQDESTDHHLADAQVDRLISENADLHVLIRKISEITSRTVQGSYKRDLTLAISELIHAWKGGNHV